MLVKPTLPRQAVRQRKLLDLLFDSPDFVSTKDLVRALYNDDSPASHRAFRLVLMNLRARCWGLDIESVSGYRVREAHD